VTVEGLRYRILVVDDERAVRAGLRRLLEGLDADVEEAGSGEEALASLTPGRWDLILLDISLPGMSGLVALEQIQLLCPGLPVAIVSGMGVDPYAGEALRRGAAAFVSKDRAHTDLLDVVRRLLSTTRVGGQGAT